VHRAHGVGELKFLETHHAVYTVEGVGRLKIDGAEVQTTAGETTFIPAGVKWQLEVGSSYAKAYVFANGGGIGEILTSVGEKYLDAGIPSKVQSSNAGDVKNLEAELGFIV